MLPVGVCAHHQEAREWCAQRAQPMAGGWRDLKKAPAERTAKYNPTGACLIQAEAAQLDQRRTLATMEAEVRAKLVPVPGLAARGGGFALQPKWQRRARVATRAQRTSPKSKGDSDHMET
jgi:hypothetical protein